MDTEQQFSERQNVYINEEAKDITKTKDADKFSGTKFYQWILTWAWAFLHA